MAVMTAEEYRAGIARLGLSQQAAALFFGVGPRTSQRFAIDGDVSEPVARFLRYLVATEADPAKVRVIVAAPITTPPPP